MMATPKKPTKAERRRAHLARQKKKLTYAEKIAGRIRKVMDTCCSATWATDVREGRTSYPPTCRKGFGMMLSKCHVLTTGADVCNPRGTEGERRWTPPQNVSLEDRLDEMTVKQADDHVHPSAIVYGARPAPFDSGLNAIHRVTLGEDKIIYRMTVLEPWREKRSNVRVRVGRRVIAYEPWHDLPEEVGMNVFEHLPEAKG